MTDEGSPKSFAAIQAEEFRRELPGTVGCVTTYAFIALIACSMFVPAPYGLIAAVCLVLLYIGSIVLFGQGSIVEMGLLALILLALACLCGRIIGLVQWPPDTTATMIEIGG